MEKLNILKYNKWLSKILSRDVYLLKFGKDHVHKIKDKDSGEFWELNHILNKSPVFVFCRVPTTELVAVKFLEELGFNVIDTNVTYEKFLNNNNCIPNQRNLRLASPGDRDDVVQLARGTFLYSRFHQDPIIPDELANELKSEWANNYFLGLRGDKMIVKTSPQGVVGFLQLLRTGKVVVIDLIAVGTKHQKENIASELISFAELEYSNCSVIRVGTQIANIPSIRLYEKLGFKLVQSQYIFHYHN